MPPELESLQNTPRTVVPKEQTQQKEEKGEQEKKEQPAVAQKEQAQQKEEKREQEKKEQPGAAQKEQEQKEEKEEEREEQPQEEAAVQSEQEHRKKPPKGFGQSIGRIKEKWEILIKPNTPKAEADRMRQERTEELQKYLNETGMQHKLADILGRIAKAENRENFFYVANSYQQKKRTDDKHIDSDSQSLLQAMMYAALHTSHPMVVASHKAYDDWAGLGPCRMPRELTVIQNWNSLFA